MFRILLLAVILQIINSESFISENVVFEKVNEITTTRSRWLVAFVIDTDPYQEILSKITESFQDIKTRLYKTWNEVPKLSNLAQNRVSNILNMLYAELGNLEISQTFLKEELAEIHSMHRTERSLLPIVGKALSFLFGTLSEADIDAIRSNVIKLAQGQEKLRHVVEGSLTILKTTQGQTVNNTKAINDVIEGLADLSEASHNLSEEVREMQYYTEVYTMLDRAATEAQSLIDMARDSSQNLKLQLNMLSLGHLSPSVISPNELRKLLGDVKGQLSSQFKFPFDPRKDIWTFYKTLTCTTLMEGGQLIVVISIPLLDNVGAFEVFRIHNMALPLNGSNQTNVLARFSLEASAIAVNKRRTHFAALSASELRDCSDPLKTYCTFKSPVYSIVSTEMCVIQVFLGHQDGITKLCKTVIQPNDPSPQARYLTDGHWAITSAVPLTFSVICNSTASSSKVITTRTPIDIISLDLTCSAFNGYMTLLPFFQKRTHYNLTDQFRRFIQNYHFGLIKVWRQFELKVPNFLAIKIPAKLKEIKEIPMDNLINELQESQVELEDMPAGPPFWVYMLDAVGLIFILVILFKFRRRLRNYFSKFKICKRSVKRGKEEVGRSAPDHPDVQPSAPSREDEPVEDDPTPCINGPSMKYKPDRELAAAYLKEKYMIEPSCGNHHNNAGQQHRRNPSQFFQTGHDVRETCDYEYGTHPAGGFYFRKIKKDRPRSTTFVTSAETQTLANDSTASRSTKSLPGTVTFDENDTKPIPVSRSCKESKSKSRQKMNNISRSQETDNPMNSLNMTTSRSKTEDSEDVPRSPDYRSNEQCKYNQDDGTVTPEDSATSKISGHDVTVETADYPVSLQQRLAETGMNPLVIRNGLYPRLQSFD